MVDIDLIDQTFWTTQSLKTGEIAEKIAGLIGRREDEFKPTVFWGGRFTENRNEKYDSSKVPKYIEAMIDSDVNYVVLTNSERRKHDIIFGFTVSMLKEFSIIKFQVTHNYLTEDGCLKKFLDIGKEIDNIISPLFGKVHDIADSNFIIEEIVKEETYRILEKIPAAFWGNYFGKHYIEKIGREKLLSFSGYKVEELENGDIYIQTTPSPLNPSSREDRKAQHSLAKLIGINKQ